MLKKNNTDINTIGLKNINPITNNITKKNKNIGKNRKGIDSLPISK